MLMFLIFALFICWSAKYFVFDFDLDLDFVKAEDSSVNVFMFRETFEDSKEAADL